MNCILRFVLVTATMAVSAATQTWPPLFATVRGNAVMNAPFTVGAHHVNRTTRCLIVLDATTLPFPPGTSINRLSFRRDAAYPSQSYPSATGTLHLRMGRARSRPDEFNDPRFYQAFEGTSSLVYLSATGSPFVLPASPPPGGTAPAPFNVVIDFQRPFVWQGGPLAIELLWTPTAGSSAFRLDAVALPRRAGISRTVAQGCTGSNGFEPTHFVHPESTSPGKVLVTQLEGAKAPTQQVELMALHVLGFQNTGPALPLPLSTVGGAPNCFLRVDPVFTQPFLVSNPSRMFARAISATPLPPHQSLVGTVLYSQWLCFDTGFSSPLPLTASDVQSIMLGPVALPESPRLVRTFWRYGSAMAGNEAGVYVPDDYGPVMRFN